MLFRSNEHDFLDIFLHFIVDTSIKFKVTLSAAHTVLAHQSSVYYLDSEIT